MAPLVSWMNFALRFMACFAGASLVSLAVYWVFHGRGAFRQFFQVVLPAFALYLVGISIVIAYETDDLSSLLFPTLVLLGLSGLTAGIQKALNEHRRPLVHGWGHSLLVHLCTLAVGGIFYVPQGGLSIASPLARGYAAGLLLGPLSIAALRLMTRDLELRPGFDRPLTGNDEVC